MTESPVNAPETRSSEHKPFPIEPWLFGAFGSGFLFLPLFIGSAVLTPLAMAAVATLPIWVIGLFLVKAFEHRRASSGEERRPYGATILMTTICMVVLIFISNAVLVGLMTRLGLRDWIDIGAHL